MHWILHLYIMLLKMACWSLASLARRTFYAFSCAASKFMNATLGTVDGVQGGFIGRTFGIYVSNTTTWKEVPALIILPVTVALVSIGLLRSQRILLTIAKAAKWIIKIGTSIIARKQHQHQRKRGAVLSNFSVRSVPVLSRKRGIVEVNTRVSVGRVMKTLIDNHVHAAPVFAKRFIRWARRFGIPLSRKAHAAIRWRGGSKRYNGSLLAER